MNYFQGLLEELHLIYWAWAPPEPVEIAVFMGCNDPYRNTLVPASYRETVQHLLEPWGTNRRRWFAAFEEDKEELAC